MDRRDFFRTIFRISATTAAIGVSAYVLLKNNGNEEACKTFNACSNCSSLKSCEKPQATAFKNDGK